MVLRLPLPLRLVLALGLLFPAGFLMGFPFPAAMRLRLKTPEQRAYGWAANGSASVLASILSVQIALSLGISRLFLFGGAAYLVASIASLRYKDRR